jgi:hypothetical protein
MIGIVSPSWGLIGFSEGKFCVDRAVNLSQFFGREVRHALRRIEIPHQVCRMHFNQPACTARASDMQVGHYCTVFGFRSGIGIMFSATVGGRTADPSTDATCVPKGITAS